MTDHPQVEAGPPRPADPFHSLIKPAGSLCNIDCTYCYYLQTKTSRGEAESGRIGAEVLEELVRQYIEGQDADEVVFTWHGGEPMLLGLDFYREVVRLQGEHAGGKRIENDLQTNGLLLDEAWCAFLKEHRFLVGLSIDGPRALHDRFRTTRGREPTFDRVLAATRLLQRFEILFNTLTVVHAGNVRHPEEVYAFLTEELGSSRLQWLPCVERADFRTVSPGRWTAAEMPIMGSPEARPGRPGSVVTDWSVDPDDWGDFLCRTFDLWLERGLGTVLVNWFESLVGQWLGQPPQLCALAKQCGRGLAVEADGTVYSCDRFAYPEFVVGRVGEPDRSLADIVESPRQRAFGQDKHDTLTSWCRRCPYLFACQGDCPRYRFVASPEGEPGVSYLCPGIRRFLAHADPGLRWIAARILPILGEPG